MKPTIKSLTEALDEQRKKIESLVNEQQSLKTENGVLRRTAIDKDCQMKAQDERHRDSLIYLKLEIAAQIKSAIHLLEYSGMDNCTHRMKKYHSERAIAVFQNQLNDIMEDIKNGITLPF